MQIFSAVAVKSKKGSFCFVFSAKLQFDFIFDGVGNCAKMGPAKNKKREGWSGGKHNGNALVN